MHPSLGTQIEALLESGTTCAGMHGRVVFKRRRKHATREQEAEGEQAACAGEEEGGPEPALTLRLPSQLLLGIVKVFSRQVIYLQQASIKRTAPATA